MSSSAHEQLKMEKIFRAGAKLVAEQYSGTINGWLAPAFESCDSEKGTLTCSFSMRKEYSDPSGNLHNGLTYALFDIAMGAMAGYYAGQMTPTISMNVSYLHPIPIDRPIFVRVHINQYGDTVSNLFAEAFTADAPDTILATAAGTYLSRKKN